MENERSAHDEALITEFATMVHETERAAAVLVRPWQVATGVLTLALTAALLWRK